MKKVHCVCLGLFWLAALVCLSSASQASRPKEAILNRDRHIWVNVGSGFASVPKGLGEDDGGLAAGASLSYRNGGSLFSVRWVTNFEFQLDIWGESGPAETVWDLGALYGRVAKAEHGMASMSAGVGVVGGSREGNRVPLHMGIPVDIQLFWTPSSVVGIGIYGFADVNSYKHFRGLLLCIQYCRDW